MSLSKHRIKPNFCLAKLQRALINNDLPNFQQIPLCLLGQRPVEHQASMRKVIKILAPNIAMQPLQTQVFAK